MASFKEKKDTFRQKLFLSNIFNAWYCKLVLLL